MSQTKQKLTVGMEVDLKERKGFAGGKMVVLGFHGRGCNHCVHFKPVGADDAEWQNLTTREFRDLIIH